MPRTSSRYPRPYLEIEFNQQLLTQEGCCRYVPIVMRLCNVPEHVMLTVLFERVRRKDQDGTYLDEYEVHPHNLYDLRVHRDFPGYNEYATELLARPNATETGSVHIKMESQSYSLLSEVIYRFDSRMPEPVRASFHDGSFRGFRLIPFLRTTQAREALHGQYPAFMPRETAPSPQPVASMVGQQPEDSSSLRTYWLRGA